MNQKGREILMANKLFKKKISLGYKYNDAAVKSASSKEINYPSMYISNTKLPLKSEEVGNKFRAMIDVEFTGIQEETNKKNKSLSYNFDVKTIEFINSK